MDIKSTFHKKNDSFQFLSYILRGIWVSLRFCLDRFEWTRHGNVGVQSKKKAPFLYPRLLVCMLFPPEKYFAKKAHVGIDKPKSNIFETFRIEQIEEMELFALHRLRKWNFSH